MFKTLGATYLRKKETQVLPKKKKETQVVEVKC